MATITKLPTGLYAIDGLTQGPFIVLSLSALDDLLQAMIDAGMIANNGVVITRPPAA